MFPFSRLLKVQSRFMTWVRYYVCFCKAAAFMSGLLISRKLVDLAIVGVLITYFSDSEYSKVFTFQKAAIFTSIQDVILATLTVVAAWISCYAIRPLRILIFSTVSYNLALGLLFCTASREFSETNFELLNMIGIILLAVGEVGAAPLLGPFLAYQLRQHGEGGRTENSNEDQVMAQKRVWWRFAWCCGTAAAFYANNIKTWKKTFMFTLLFMGGSLILLLLETSSTSKEQEEAGTLCTVAQVRESKSLLKLLPLWSSFIVFGLVLSAGLVLFSSDSFTLESIACTH
ncbi:hypothetical protein WN944_026272 [Citrus x changshan-huyou]|uniref:Uncharacterized protein n=1 Tax=Citrus x changshan-huyou TaxID=2935761 RepID=A0AAP0QC78_9ROSI